MKKSDTRNGSEGIGFVRVLNEQAVLEAILNHGENTRPQIARHTGLSLPTVMAVVSTLEEIGLVCNQGANSGALGRPAALYSLNPEAGYIFAVDMGGTKILAGITNLSGEVIAQHTEQTAKESAGATIDQLVQIHQMLLEQSDYDQNAVGVACIGMPGVWDPETDRINAAFNIPSLNEIPLHATIQEALGLPVAIENDVNLAAVGEAWKGLAQGHDTFVAISVGTGIGMGIVINGEIYRGRSGAAGEIGLLPVCKNPFDPSLQPQGAFETVASGPSIHNRLIRLLEEGRPSILTSDADVNQIVEAGKAGDAVAQFVLDEEARYLAIGIASVVAVLDPSLVILGGGVGANEELLQPVCQYAEQLIAWMPPVEVSVLKNEAAFYGAIAYGLPIVREQILVAAR